MSPRTIKIGAITLAAVVWLPTLHLFYAIPIRWKGVDAWSSQKAALLAAHLTALWENPELHGEDNASMASINPEWDFMSRTFSVLGLANWAFRHPEKQTEMLRVMDLMIEDTLRLESEKGFHYFVMRYGQTNAGWVQTPPRSLFVDGEIALMLAARRMVQDSARYRTLHKERIKTIVGRLEAAPILSVESYPDECWLFCNTVALAAVRIGDHLDHTDHRRLFNRWVKMAKAHLVDSRTGLFISAYSMNGTPAACGWHPEGSSIWLAAHMLQLLDPELAKDQYRRARRELGRTILGFGYSREWPQGEIGSMDVDSGPVLPILEASASASGLAIIAAQAFGDHAYFRQLMAALEFTGFPQRQKSGLTYRAGNTIGDAVIFYALSAGPLWQACLNESK